jgi:hypothetical protein
MDTHRRVILTAEGLIGVLVAAAAMVGIYDIANPNGIQFGSPLPVTAELASLVAAGITTLGVWFARDRREWAPLVVGVVLCVLALMLLGFVAFALSFNQT